MLFSERLKDLIVDSNLTWKEISDRLEIGKNQQKYWIDNDSAPNGKVLIKLADFFGVTTDYLLGLTDIKEKAVPILTEQEQLILDIYRSVPAQSQFHIIQVCMNEKENFKKENSQAI